MVVTVRLPRSFTSIIINGAFGSAAFFAAFLGAESPLALTLNAATPEERAAVSASMGFPEPSPMVDDAAAAGAAAAAFKR